MSIARKSNFDDDVSAPFIDVFASILYVIILSLLLSLLKSQRTSEESEVVKQDILEQQNELELAIKELHKRTLDANEAKANIESTQNFISQQLQLRKELSKDLYTKLGNVISIDKNTGIITLSEDILTFSINDDRINSVGKKTLLKIIKPLALVAFSKKYKKNLQKIIIEGHTDSTVSYKDNYYNWKLSANRALKVLEFFIENSGHYKSDYLHFLETTGMSNKSPIYQNGKEHKTRSRRIEIKVLLDDKKAIESMAIEIQKALTNGETDE